MGFIYLLKTKYFPNKIYIMAFKFGSLFDEMLNQGFGANQQNQEDEYTQKDEEYLNAIERINTILKQQEENQTISNKQLQKYERIKDRLNEKRNNLLNQELNYSKEANDLFETLSERQGAGTATTLRESAQIFSENMENLTSKLQEGEIGLGDFRQQIGQFSTEGMANAANAFVQGQEDFGETFRNVLVNTLQYSISSALPIALKPFAGVMAEAIVKTSQSAIDQLMELNTQFIELQRNTAGVIRANQLGMDVYGNMQNSINTIKSEVIDANISVEEFTGAMEEFATEGMGSIIGADIRSQARHLREFGIEAARIQKHYNVSIAPIVSDMFMKFGEIGAPIKETTNLLSEAIKNANEMHLDPRLLASNIRQAMDMTNEITFKKGKEGIVEMAELATKLGTDVETIQNRQATTIPEMMERQRNFMMMGMENMARQMPRAFAMQQQDKQAEATRIKKIASAKDIMGQGFFNEETGVISQAGKDMLADLNMSDQVDSVRRMLIEMADSGEGAAQVLKEMNEPTEIEQAKRTVSEQFGLAWERIRQSVLSPLQQVFTNIVPPIAKFTNEITKVIEPLIKMGGLVYSITRWLNPWTAAISALVLGFDDFVNNMLPGIKAFGKELSLLWKELRPVIMPLIKIFNELASMVMGVFGDILSDTLKALAQELKGLRLLFGELSSALAWVPGVETEKEKMKDKKEMEKFKEKGAWGKTKSIMLEENLGLLSDKVGNVLQSPMGYNKKQRLKELDSEFMKAKPSGKTTASIPDSNRGGGGEGDQNNITNNNTTNNNQVASNDKKPVNINLKIEDLSQKSKQIRTTA